MNFLDSYTQNKKLSWKSISKVTLSPLPNTEKFDRKCIPTSLRKLVKSSTSSEIRASSHVASHEYIQRILHTTSCKILYLKTIFWLGFFMI